MSNYYYCGYFIQRGHGYICEKYIREADPVLTNVQNDHNCTDFACVHIENLDNLEADFVHTIHSYAQHLSRVSALMLYNSCTRLSKGFFSDNLQHACSSTLYTSYSSKLR